MVTDVEWDLALKAMELAGIRDGRAAGSWVADGNTSEIALRHMLKMWDDGDPAAPDAPQPFSGEWADSATVEDVIDAETELDAESLTPEERDDLATTYETAYAAAWYDEAESTVRGFLPE